MKFDEIAVIGMSCCFPKADTIDSFRTMLCEGKDAVRRISQNKKSRYGYTDRIDEKEYAFLETEDHFDPEFFGISETEALELTAVGRNLLKLCVQAVEQAGYSLDELKEHRTGLIVSLSEEELTDQTDLLSGKGGMVLGKIAHYLGGIHKAYLVDTTCTSALTAIHQACTELRADECDMVIAASFHLTQFRNTPQGYRCVEELTKIASPDFRSYPFQERANGTGIGEGGGAVLLKRISDAIRDRDSVDAVICGSSMAYTGSEKTDLSIPEERTLLRNVTEAMKYADVKVSQIGSIEAHGTGTKIGDAIELQAYAKALTGSERKCRITAVKSNIGHLEHAAGMASFIKMVLQVSEGKHYPICGFHDKTTAVAWENSTLLPCDTLLDWDEEERFGIVGSYAMNGSCVHMVMRNAKKQQVDEVVQRPCVLRLSAQARDLLEQLIDSCCTALGSLPQQDLADFAFTMNTGRPKCKYTAAVTGSTCEEMIQALHSCQTEKITERLKATTVVLLCSGSGEAKAQTPEEYVKEKFRQISYLRDLGILVHSVLGCGLGNVVVRYWQNNSISDEELQSDIERWKDQNGCNEEKFLQYIHKQTSGGDVIYLTAEEGLLGSLLEHDGTAELVRLEKIAGAEKLLQILCSKGADIDWHMYYRTTGQHLRRIAVPASPLKDKIIWRNMQ